MALSLADCTAPKRSEELERGIEPHPQRPLGHLAGAYGENHAYAKDDGIEPNRMEARYHVLGKRHHSSGYWYDALTG